MKLIIDSGSSKTEGVVCRPNGEEVYAFGCAGLNPLFHDTETIYHELRNGLADCADRAWISEVYYYGAGCSDDERKKRVSDAIIQLFPALDKILIEHDLWGAARAHYHGKKYVCCILGTGSNSAIFDGHQLIAIKPSLGYILGDEGSGADIGKTLLRDYLYGYMPDGLKNEFAKHFPGSSTDFVNLIYRADRPNQKLASFSRFVGEKVGEYTYLRDLVARCFKKFIEVHVEPALDKEVRSAGFVGSVAYYFRDILEVSLQEKGIELDGISQRPLSGLQRYHSA